MSTARVAFAGFAFLVIVSPHGGGTSAQQVPESRAAVPGQVAPGVPSPEGFVVERLNTSVRFETDGTSEYEMAVGVRVMTDAAVQQLGQVGMGYDASLGTARFDYVEVRKPTGQVIRAAPDALQDLAVQFLPNVLSDLHQIRAAVPAVAPGDLVAYRILSRVTRPQVPGQFWFAHRFTSAAVVAEETLAIDVPAGRAVRIKTAPGAEPATPGGDVSGGRRTYRWKRSSPAEQVDATLAALVRKAADGRLDPPDVQITTFDTWDDVARWYLEASSGRDRPDAVIRQTAEELTRGLTSPADKLRALYEFVSTQFRYLSLSFGSGWLVPHKASEVLANRYGDCKDRHTLLAALTRAVGIDTYPALVSSVQLVDRAVPSLLQFDHMITVGALGRDERDWVWLDTSAGVAPFGFIAPALRNKTALVLVASPGPTAAGGQAGPGRLVTTPALSPIPAYTRMRVEARLTELGMLDSRVTWEIRGDAEVAIRTALRTMPADRHVEVLKAIATSLQLTGDLVETSVSDPLATRDPLRLGFRVRRGNWFDRSDGGPLVLPFETSSLSYATEKEWEGLMSVRPWPGPSESAQSVVIELPPGYVPKVPLDVSVARDYASYRSSYRLDGRRLIVERVLTMKPAELPPDRMRDYLAFAAAVRADPAQLVRVDTPAAAPATPEADATPSEHYSAGMAAYRRKDYRGAIDAWQRLVAIEPKHSTAWDSIGLARIELAQWPEAVAALETQVKVEPFHDQAWGNLGWALQHVNRRADAIAAYRKQIEVAPLNKSSNRRLGILLLGEPADYPGAAASLARAEQMTPDDPEVVARLGRALLAMGENARAIGAFERAYKLNPSAARLSEMAYDLADAGLELQKALEWGREAVQKAAEQSLTLDIETARLDQADSSWALSWSWHALGWAAFRKGDMPGAERYLLAARSVRSTASIPDHLAQVLEKSGRDRDAVRFVAESLIYKDDPSVRQRLVRLAGGEDAAARAIESAYAALVKERTIGLPRVGPKAGSLEFVAIITNGSEHPEVRAAERDDDFGPVLEQVRKVSVPVVFPDQTPARILTNGRLACKEKGGECAAMVYFGARLPAMPHK